MLLILSGAGESGKSTIVKQMKWVTTITNNRIKYLVEYLHLTAGNLTAVGVILKKNLPQVELNKVGEESWALGSHTDELEPDIGREGTSGKCWHPGNRSTRVG